MTREELIELSKQAAEVLGIEPKEIYPSHFSFTDKTIHGFSTLWLAEDSGRCADIAADRLIHVYHDDYSVATNYRGRFMLADHNGDRKQAWRVAVLKAVIELGRQS
jgi:hypothetical protein